MDITRNPRRMRSEKGTKCDENSLMVAETRWILAQGETQCKRAPIGGNWRSRARTVAECNGHQARHWLPQHPGLFHPSPLLPRFFKYARMLPIWPTPSTFSTTNPCFRPRGRNSLRARHAPRRRLLRPARAVGVRGNDPITIIHDSSHSYRRRHRAADAP